MAEWTVEIEDGNPHIKKMIPLVRCKDCRYAKPYNKVWHKPIRNIMWCTLYDLSEYGERKYDDFCSRGEKVTE